MKAGSFIFYITLFFTINSSIGAPVELVNNLEDNFLIWDSKTDRLVPYLPHYHNTTSIYFIVPKEEYKNNVLFLESEEKFSIFVNGKLFNEYGAGITSIVGNTFEKKSVDILIGIVLHNNSPAFLFKAALYRIHDHRLPLVQQTEKTKTLFQQTFEDIKQNSILAKNRYIIGIFLSLCVFMIIKGLFPVFFVTIFSVNKNPQQLNERNALRVNYFQNETFFVIVLASVLIGVYLYVFSERIYIFRKIYILEQYHGFVVFILGVLMTIGLFSIKIFINLVTAIIFNTSGFAKNLANEFSKTVLQVLLVLYPFYFLILSPFSSLNMFDYIYTIYPIGILVIIFILKELYYFYELFNFRKFYIIAYICICDLFPTLVLIKVLTQLEFTQ